MGRSGQSESSAFRHGRVAVYYLLEHSLSLFQVVKVSFCSQHNIQVSNKDFKLMLERVKLRGAAMQQRPQRSESSCQPEVTINSSDLDPSSGLLMTGPSFA